MVKLDPILEKFVDDYTDPLPSNWNMPLEEFSNEIKYHSFQKEALEKIRKCLYIYFQEEETLRKAKFFEKYENNGLTENPVTKLFKTKKKTNEKIAVFDEVIMDELKKNFSLKNESLEFSEICNRAAFWMATGSGKSLVLVQLAGILFHLMELKAIPEKEIMMLSSRQDLVDQLKGHVNDFNSLSGQRGFKIKLVDLKEYEKTKHTATNEKIIYYFRSDLLTDENSKNEVDFRDYDNGGNWYMLLDEAHKGDTADSKRQMYYTILTRNGFLFNFSATLPDELNRISTIFNYNLEKFVRDGFSKNIYLSGTELKALTKDYSKDKKQIIILKTLILLTYIKKQYKEICKKESKAYHEPLLLTLVNTVNWDLKKIPDLKLFFDLIVDISNKSVKASVYSKALKEIAEDFAKQPCLMYSSKGIEIKQNELQSITLENILEHVFNDINGTGGKIEAMKFSGNEKEAAFQLHETGKPFAVMKIADAGKWLKENLKNKIDVTETVEDKQYFKNIEREKEISILMGSRAFYEGWDSNRPNLILYINIGTSGEAEKFVIQSLGRGVRIQPIPGKRKRLLELSNNNDDCDLFGKIKDLIQPLETLFVFGTIRKSLDQVLKQLKENEFEKTVPLDKNPEIKMKLLIPRFVKSPKKLYEETEPKPFSILNWQKSYLDEYFTKVDERILLVRHDLSQDIIKHVKSELKATNPKTIDVDNIEDANLPTDVLIQKINTHLNIKEEILDDPKVSELTGQIMHFEQIKISLESKKDTDEFESKVKLITDYKKKGEGYMEEFNKKKITLVEFTEKIQQLGKGTEDFKELKLAYLANHYYLPLIYSTKEKIDYIKHIITHTSEVRFIGMLEEWVRNNKIACKWAFSRIDEHLDKIHIPYYDPATNVVRHFMPDFIFWLNKGDKYSIVFADPKGFGHSAYEHKVDGYKKLFEDAPLQPKEFTYDGLKITVSLFLFNKESHAVSKGYKGYWTDEIQKIFDTVE